MTLQECALGSGRKGEAFLGPSRWGRTGSAGLPVELREQGIHVSLLIVDAGIQTLDGSRRGAALADAYEIAYAVRFLGEQGASAATHELQVTPLGERWVP